MTTQAEVVCPLTDVAAAQYAGVPVETIWFWREIGFIKPVENVIGPRYALADVQAVLSGDVLPGRTQYLKPGDAASRLGVNVVTLAKKAAEGRLTAWRRQDGKRQYDAAEIRAIAEKRREQGFASWWPEPKPTD